MEASIGYIRTRTVINIFACIYTVIFLVACGMAHRFSKGLSCPQFQTKHPLSGRNSERTTFPAYSYLRQKHGKSINRIKTNDLNSIRAHTMSTSKNSLSQTPLLASQNRIFPLRVLLARDTPPGQRKPAPPADVPEIIFFGEDIKRAPPPPTTTSRTERKQRKKEARRTQVRHPAPQTGGTTSSAGLDPSSVNAVQSWLALAMSSMFIPFLFPLTIVCWIGYVRAMRQLYGMEPPAGVRNYYWTMFTLLLLMYLLLLLALLGGL